MMFKVLPKAPMRRIAALFVMASIIFASGCITGPRIVTPKVPALPQGGPPIPNDNDGVLAAGTQVVAHTPEGPIKIEAGPGTRRVYTWNGLRRGAILKPRQQPFAGETHNGLYFNGTPKVWAPADGITRLRAEEGERNFDNIDDAKIWMQIRRLYYAYNDSGLVVGWKHRGDTLHVELWQFYIDGKQPDNMPGADDSLVQTEPVHAVPQKMQPELVFADGHTEPYNTVTAAKYSGAHVAKAGQTNSSTSATGGPGNWFQRHIVAPIKRAFGHGSDSATSGRVGTASGSGAIPASNDQSSAGTGKTPASNDQSSPDNGKTPTSNGQSGPDNGKTPTSSDQSSAGTDAAPASSGQSGASPTAPAKESKTAPPSEKPGANDKP